MGHNQNWGASCGIKRFGRVEGTARNMLQMYAPRLRTACARRVESTTLAPSIQMGWEKTGRNLEMGAVAKL